ncbi:MAG: Rhs element Vgr protein [Rubrivivax sp.]|nr:Rhs element Vgr protein [Rubrivivax sp.]
MSDDLFETLRKLVRHELRQQRFAELGVVQAVYASDPGNHDADVVLYATQLVLRHVPLMTPRKGIASLPDVGDLVLVQFLGGDINRPVVVGTLYNGEDRPPEHAEGQWVLQLPSGPDAAEDGVRLEIRQDGPAGFTLSVKGDKFKLVVQDDDPVARLDVAGTTLTIDGGGAVKVEGAGDMQVKASGNLKLEAGGNAELVAGGTLKLAGSVVNIN